MHVHNNSSLFIFCIITGFYGLFCYVIGLIRVMCERMWTFLIRGLSTISSKTGNPNSITLLSFVYLTHIPMSHFYCLNHIKCISISASNTHIYCPINMLESYGILYEGEFLLLGYVLLFLSKYSHVHCYYGNGILNNVTYLLNLNIFCDFGNYGWICNGLSWNRLMLEMYGIL